MSWKTKAQNPVPFHLRFSKFLRAKCYLLDLLLDNDVFLSTFVIYHSAEQTPCCVHSFITVLLSYLPSDRQIK